jgi:hypothetical protein
MGHPKKVQVQAINSWTRLRRLQRYFQDADVINLSRSSLLLPSLQRVSNAGFERARLQPCHQRRKMGAALAAEGRFSSFLTAWQHALILSLCTVLSGCASFTVNPAVAKIPANPADPVADTGKLMLKASATLTPDEIAQPENIFLYSFPLPQGKQNFIGLKGQIALTSQEAVFNESLISVAANSDEYCPANGIRFPNYNAVYSVFPNLHPIQSFILKSPDAGTSQIAIDYTMPVGVPVSECIVVMLDWMGGSAVTMSSNLTLSYTSAAKPPTGKLLGTNQEFVFGNAQGPKSTTDDALSFAQETIVPQAGTILGFVGDVSDSTYFVAPPPGEWQTANDIYLVPGGCPAGITVDSAGATEQAGDYYSLLPANAQHLLSVPLGGSAAAVAQQPVFQAANVKVQKGDCLLTIFGLNAPQGGGVDAETQVKTLFLPAQ